jgi:hypothetical protein
MNPFAVIALVIGILIALAAVDQSPVVGTAIVFGLAIALNSFRNDDEGRPKFVFDGKTIQDSIWITVAVWVFIFVFFHLIGGIGGSGSCGRSTPQFC